MQNSSNNAMKIVRKFLMAWKRLDHEAMYECCTPTWKSKHTFEQLKEMYPESLSGYSVKLGKKITEVVYDVECVLKAKDGELKRKIRVICEKGPFLPSLKGDFRVNPVSWRDK